MASFIPGQEEQEEDASELKFPKGEIILIVSMFWDNVFSSEWLDSFDCMCPTYSFLCSAIMAMGQPVYNSKDYQYVSF